MTDGHTNFWLALLKLGEDEAKRRRNWNNYCAWKYGAVLPQLVAPDHFEAVSEELGVGRITNDIVKHLDEFAEKNGGHPELPTDSSVTHTSFMSFSSEEFPDDVSFAGRVLIGADFREAEFRQCADFRDAIFLGLTRFNKATFHGTEKNLYVASFSHSTFHNTVHFNSVKFPYTTRIENVTFHGPAQFQAAEFKSMTTPSGDNLGTVNFSRSMFESKSDFAEATFCVSALFENAEFQDITDFGSANFQKRVTFNNAKFKGTTSFRNASFGTPPKFFETEIHEDVNFNRVDWSDAVRSYSRGHGQREGTVSVEELAEDAIRVWDRLALIMGQQEKLPERHEFFRLMMRAQRERDGHRSLSSFANWLFDKSSDYGWGMVRAFSWWAGHIFAGMIILALAALVCPSYLDLGVIRTAWFSLLVSFANAHAILGLASESGHLHSARLALDSAAEADWVFSAVGTVQAILGPILLFLVLLTLRNRFRLG